MACIYPYFTKYGHSVPCGKCPVCLEARTASWVFRLQQEFKVSKSAHFVTFTYAPEFLPKSKNNFNTLVKSDLQNFFKRLRKIAGKGVKYYAVGEYGTNFKRPHYHAIIFNCTDVNLYSNCWELKKNGKPFGSVFIDEFNSNTCGYVAGYIQKPRIKPLHINDDRIPEFSLMSKGLGLSYLTDEMIDYHKNGEITFMQSDKRKLPLNRYYKEKIFKDVDLSHLVFEQQQKFQIKERERFEEHLKNYPDDTYDDYWEIKNQRRKASYNNMIRQKLLKIQKL